MRSACSCENATALTAVAQLLFSTIIPEIQATAKPDTVKTMNKAIWLLYTQLALTYIPAAVRVMVADGQVRP